MARYARLESDVDLDEEAESYTGTDWYMEATVLYSYLTAVMYSSSINK